MKRVLSAFLVILTLFSALFLAACKKEPPVQEYVVNSTGVIYIGVLLPLSGDNAQLGQKYLESITYAKETASKIKLDTEYQIELVTVDTAELDLAYNRFNEKKVTSIICFAGDKTITEDVINKFSQSGIPLVFLDNRSNLISTSKNVFSLSVFYNYQCSAISTYLGENFMKSGAVLLSADSDYNRSFADMFDSAFLNVGGMPVVDYVYDDAGTSVEAIVSSEYDFVFVIGSDNKSLECFRKLRAKGFKGQIILSEVFDKTDLFDPEYEGLTFISKFEIDDENYIGSDFINVYSKKNSVNKDDVNAVIAYGYDAYMLIYEVLSSFAKDDPLAALSGKESEETNISDISLSAVSDALGKVTYYGVTDVISFNENGVAKTNFIYINSVVSAFPEIIDKYSFSN